ncbi:MAG: hypothetical protein KKA64_02835 [Nanoarchaeota archaeon]|nr:hypothetical protein [Nanoarchaeota archaeon]
MSISAVRRIDCSKFEKILNALPNPNNVRIRVYNLDYSSLEQQVAEIIPDTDINGMGLRIPSEYILNRPAKETALRIYKDDIETEGIPFTGTKRGKIQFVEAEWSFDGKSRLVFDGFDVNMEYKGKEPKMFSELIKILEDERVRYSLRFEL